MSCVKTLDMHVMQAHIVKLQCGDTFLIDDPLMTYFGESEATLQSFHNSTHLQSWVILYHCLENLVFTKLPIF